MSYRSAWRAFTEDHDEREASDPAVRLVKMQQKLPGSEQKATKSTKVPTEKPLARDTLRSFVAFCK